MSSQPQTPPEKDLTARVDLERVQNSVPVIMNVGDLAVPGIFESDDDLEDFLDFVREDRGAGVS